MDLGPLPRRGRQAAGRRAGVLRAIGQVHRHRRRWRARSVRVRRLRGSGHVLAQRRHGDVSCRAAPRGPQHQQFLDGGRFLGRGSRRQRGYPGGRHAGSRATPQDPSPHPHTVAQAGRTDRRPPPVAAQHVAVEPRGRDVRADRRLRRDRGIRLVVGRPVPRRRPGRVRRRPGDHGPPVGRDGRGYVGAHSGHVHGTRVASGARLVPETGHEERGLSQQRGPHIQRCRRQVGLCWRGCHLARYGDRGPGRGWRAGRGRQPPGRARRGVPEPRERPSSGRAAPRAGTQHVRRRLQDPGAGGTGAGAAEGGRARRDVPVGIGSALRVRDRHGPGPDHRGRLAARRAHGDSRGQAESRVRDQRAAKLLGPALGITAGRACPSPQPRAPGPMVPRRVGPARSPPRRDAVQ